MKFEELNIIKPIRRALAEQQYEKPSPIQERAIPPALQGRDVLGCAQTGTGKTAAFAVPVLQLLHKNPRETGKIRALVLTPTRELALQNYECFCTYGKYLPLHSAVVFGGVSQNPQVESLRRGVEILIATPGRLNDLIGQGIVNLGSVEIFVLDEADRMLDMGFIHDVKKVIAKLPEKKQTLFFSATMPPEIMELVDSLLHHPVRVEVTPQATTVEAIAQSVYFVDKPNKSRLLIHLLEDPAIVSALVFTRTKHGADRVVRDLTRAGIHARAIHGNKSQNARQEALGSFKDGKIRVLVATDIAARGIDIEELSHVINYDLPNVPETYVHRIGRTGRAGQPGVAISFCNFDEKEYLADIEKLIRKKIPAVDDHPYPMQILEPAPPKEQRPQNSRKKEAAKPAEKDRAGQKDAGREAAPKPQKAAAPAEGQAGQEAAEQPSGKKSRRRRGKKKSAAETVLPPHEEKRPAAAAAARDAKPPREKKERAKDVSRMDSQLTAPEEKPVRGVTKFVPSKSAAKKPSDQFLTMRHLTAFPRKG